MRDEHLLKNFYVIAVISNPIRYESRVRLFKEFEQHMLDSGVKLYTVEMAFGDREHRVTQPCNARHIQLRTIEELWNKENMINIGISRLPSDWEYVAWIDTDVSFTRKDWALEAVHQLQHYEIVQLWDTALDLGPTQEVIQHHKSFAACHLRGIAIKTSWDQYYTYAHPGFGWAATRKAIDTTGGLLDKAILGAGDHHMAWALIGRAKETMPGNIGKEYWDMVMTWQDRGLLLHKDVGYVPGTLLHYWHGKKRDRRYEDRWKIITRNKFNPLVDIKKDWQGVYQLDDSRIKLRDDIRQYFRSRNEDSIDLD